MMKGLHQALIAVDLQNDFCPGGALAVPEGNRAILAVNRLSRSFQHIVYTQDWHPAGHLSFAASHPGRQPYETVELDYGRQILWPTHCVQGTRGAEFHPEADVQSGTLIIRKGFHRDIDSYSTFFENDQRTATGLAGYLRDRGIDAVYLAGLATDFCVLWSALDAQRLGFRVYVVEDACRGIDLDGSLDAAFRQMDQAGITRIQSAEITETG
jgi:nicotinamidase-related amidase